MDAFASFRTRQLQANRSSFIDLSSCNESRGDTAFQSEMDKPTRQSFLEDLHDVSYINRICMFVFVHQNSMDICNYLVPR